MMILGKVGGLVVLKSVRVDTYCDTVRVNGHVWLLYCVIKALI